MKRKIKLVPHVRVAESAVVLVIAVFLLAMAGYAAQVSQMVADIYDQANRSATSPSFPVRSLTYTDSAKLYSFTYPVTWRINDTMSATDGSNRHPDWSKTSRPFVLIANNAPADAQDTNSVQVATLAEMNARLAQSRTDKSHTVTPLTINGNTAYLDRVVFVGPSAAEKYTDDYYFIVHGKQAVVFAFRESYYHNWPPENWSNVNNLSAFQKIVSSVKFLR